MPEAAAALPFVSAGSSVLSAIGGGLGTAGAAKGLPPTQVAGFDSQPQQVKDLMLNTILPQIVAQTNKPFTTIPTRRANTADYDPVFGSQAVQNLQSYYDAKAAAAKDVTPNAASPSGAPAAPSGPAIYQPNPSRTGITGIPNSNAINKSDPRYGQTLPWFEVAGAPNPGANNPGPAYVNPNNPGPQMSGIHGLSSSDMAKLQQILAGFQGNSSAAGMQ